MSILDFNQGYLRSGARYKKPGGYLRSGARYKKLGGYLRSGARYKKPGGYLRSGARYKSQEVISGVEQDIKSRIRVLIIRHVR